MTASMNPVVTRKSEATTSCSSRPVRASSPNPLATASGDGKTDGGNNLKNHSADQTATTAASTSKGRRRAFAASGVSLIRRNENPEVHKNSSSQRGFFYLDSIFS